MSDSVVSRAEQVRLLLTGIADELQLQHRSALTPQRSGAESPLADGDGRHGKPV